MLRLSILQSFIACIFIVLAEKESVAGPTDKARLKRHHGGGHHHHGHHAGRWWGGGLGLSRWAWPRPIVAPLASPILGAQPVLATNPLGFPASMYDYGRRCCLRQFVGCPSPLCSSFAAQYFDESRQCCYKRLSKCNYPLCASSVSVSIYDFGRDCCRRRAVGCHRPLCSVGAYSYYDEYRRCCYKRVAGCFHRPLCDTTSLPFYNVGNDCCYRRISGCHRPLCARHRHGHHRHRHNLRPKRRACGWRGCENYYWWFDSSSSSSSSSSKKSAPCRSRMCIDSSTDEVEYELYRREEIRNATRQEVNQAVVVTVDQNES